jgi:signal transduction histidine kinase/ActR/RegA family two-component response regulator
VHGGLLFGHPQPGVFTERVERLVAGIASQAAIAIDNAHLYQEAQQEIARREQTEEALREADRRKDEFLATLSHELRNPLAPIRQAAALSKMPGATSAQLLWSRDVIERQVGHMAHLLDDLLDISRITRGRLELRMERIELGAVVESAIETARPLIDVRGHKLTVEIPPERVCFNADRIRVVQIISNLLTNAAKYTDTAGRIELRSQVLNGQVLICVRDTGIGIAPEMLPRLFEMFSQAESTLDRAEGGLGIGLALVRGLVELHGGTVEARSEGLGRGSEFTVRLPLTVPATPSASEMAEVSMEASPGTSGLKILVADDNVDSAESLAMLLQLHGHEVRTAYSGRAALDVAATFHPRVALLDIGMPELNGYETAERIRAQPWGQRITLVAISGWGQEDDKHRASAAGFDRHLTKPVDPEVVAAMLAELA